MWEYPVFDSDDDRIGMDGLSFRGQGVMPSHAPGWCGRVFNGTEARSANRFSIKGRCDERQSDLPKWDS